MKKIRSEFDDFLLINVLADLFEPEGSEDEELIADKIIEGLDNYGFISNKQNVNSPKSQFGVKELGSNDHNEDTLAA